MARHTDQYEKEPSYDELKAKLQELSTTVEEFVDSSSEDASDHMSALRERAQLLIDNTKDYLSSTGEHLRERGRDSMACAEDYVRGNPWTAVGISAAAGLLIGVLAGRR